MLKWHQNSFLWALRISSCQIQDTKTHWSQLTWKLLGTEEYSICWWNEMASFICRLEVWLPQGLRGKCTARLWCNRGKKMVGRSISLPNKWQGSISQPPSLPASQPRSPILSSVFDTLFGLQMYTHSKGSSLAEMSGGICYSNSYFWRSHNDSGSYLSSRKADFLHVGSPEPIHTLWNHNAPEGWAQGPDLWRAALCRDTVNV